MCFTCDARIVQKFVVNDLGELAIPFKKISVWKFLESYLGKLKECPHIRHLSNHATLPSIQKRKSTLVWPHIGMCRFSFDAVGP